MNENSLDRFRECRSDRLDQECLDRPRNVLQIEYPKLLECEVQPAVHVIAHRSRNTDATRRALCLEPRSDIHRVSVQIGSICNRITDAHPNPKPDGSVCRLLAVQDWHFSLHFCGTPDRAIDAIEDDQQGIAASLHDPATMFPDRRVDQIAAERTQALEFSRI